jgi:PAS domain S-box-containing protein
MEYPLGTVPTVELIMNRVHPEDRAQVEEMVGRAAREGARMDLKHRLIMPDGRVKHIHIIARNIAPEGKIYEIVGAVSDISEQHKTEAALKGAIARSRESEIQLRTIVDSIPTLAWRAGPDGSAEFFNERWLKYTGLSKEQADGMGWTVAVHPDDVEKLHGCWSKIITTKCEGEIEARLRRFDGEYRWFLFRAAPCLDEEENIHNLYGTNTDIEDRHASEHVVRGHLSALTQMLELLAHERDPDQLPRHVLNTILTQLGAASVSIWERHGESLDLIGVDEEGEFRTGAEAGYFEDSFPVDGEAPPLWVEALQTGTHFVIEDIDREPHRLILADGRTAVWYRRDLKPPFAHLEAHLSAQGVRGLLISPMFLAGRLSGIIKIRFKGARVFGREEIELTKALGQQAMLALQVMHLSEESRRAAVAAERNRMARDIHDTLAQGFTGVIAQLQAAKGAASSNGMADATQYIEQAEALARSSLGEARRSVRALRPRSLREGGLCIALEGLFRRMSAGASPKAVFQSHGEPRAMPLEWEQELLRIAQESLTNTINHANASQFEAVLDFEPDQIRLRLADNGRGFNPNVEHEGLGLIGMKERVDRMGGRFFLRTQPGRGTEISILLRHPKE